MSDGFRITIRRNSDSSWGGAIEESSGDRRVEARRCYRSENEAKLAAFDGMLFLKTQRGWGTS